MIEDLFHMLSCSLGRMMNVSYLRAAALKSVITLALNRFCQGECSKEV